LEVGWEPWKQVKFSVSYFDNTTPMFSGARFQRVQVEIQLKF
jgi:hypothetical protein